MERVSVVIFILIMKKQVQIREVICSRPSANKEENRT